MAEPTVGAAADAGRGRWHTSRPSDSNWAAGSARRPRNDLLVVILTSAVTMELLASLGIAFGMPQAGLLGMLTVSIPMVGASALVLRRHPNRPVASRIYLGLIGCGAVTALGLTVGAAVDALSVGATLGPLGGILVLVALTAIRRPSAEPAA